jgi:hypothetical protein
MCGCLLRYLGQRHDVLVAGTTSTAISFESFLLRQNPSNDFLALEAAFQGYEFQSTGIRLVSGGQVHCRSTLLLNGSHFFGGIPSCLDIMLRPRQLVNSVNLLNALTESHGLD